MSALAITGGKTRTPIGYSDSFRCASLPRKSGPASCGRHAMIGPTPQTRDIILLGPFTLAPDERLLTKDGAPVPLGARTLDVLIALVSRPHEVVSKHDLISQVWPDVTVEEGSLRFHVAALRKALGE